MIFRFSHICPHVYQKIKITGKVQGVGRRTLYINLPLYNGLFQPLNQKGTKLKSTNVNFSQLG